MEPAIIRFQPGAPQDPEDGPVEVSGTLHAGGGVVLRYNGLRRRYGIRELRAHVRFHPGGQLVTPGICGGEWEHWPGMRPAEVRLFREMQVPPGTRQIEIWFSGTWFVGGRSNIQEYWDSRYGQNFWFDVEG